MYKARNNVAVVDNVFAETGGTRAVKSRTADLSAARNNEVAARGGEQSHE